MNFASLGNYALNFYNQHPLMVVAAAIVLLCIACKMPKASFKFTILLLFMAAIFYAIGLFRDTLSTGTQNADQMINKTMRSEDSLK
jgi:uncharacterized membrane protein